MIAGVPAWPALLCQLAEGSIGFPQRAVKTRLKSRHASAAAAAAVLLLTPDLERRQADIWSGKIAADLSVFESESSKLRPTR